jgi:hypothetical protein
LTVKRQAPPRLITRISRLIPSSSRSVHACRLCIRSRLYADSRPLPAQRKEPAVTYSHSFSAPRFGHPFQGDPLSRTNRVRDPGRPAPVWPRKGVRSDVRYQTGAGRTLPIRAKPLD